MNNFDCWLVATIKMQQRVDKFDRFKNFIDNLHFPPAMATTLTKQLTAYDRTVEADLMRLKAAADAAVEAYESIKACVADERDHIVQDALEAHKQICRARPVDPANLSNVIIRKGDIEWPLPPNYIALSVEVTVQGSCKVLGRSKYRDEQTVMYHQTRMEDINLNDVTLFEVVGRDAITHEQWADVRDRFLTPEFNLQPTLATWVVNSITTKDTGFLDGDGDERIEYGDWDEDPKCHLTAKLYVHVYVPHIMLGDLLDDYLNQAADLPEFSIGAMTDVTDDDVVYDITELGALEPV